MQIYEPSEDSFLLAQCLREICPKITKKNKNANFLDIGTGSCIQAETAEALGFKRESILTTDKSILAVRNAKEKGFDSIYSELFSKVKGEFDLIVFNPPYLPYNKHDNNKDTCGGKKGYETAVKFVRGLKRHLKKKGAALLLISSLTNPEIVKKEIKKQGLSYRIAASQKIFFEELFVFAIKR